MALERKSSSCIEFVTEIEDVSMSQGEDVRVPVPASRSTELWNRLRKIIMAHRSFSTTLESALEDSQWCSGEGPSFVESRCSSVAINARTLKAVLDEHMRSVRGRLELFGDLELDSVSPENVSLLLKTCSQPELDALLLYAGYLGRDDLIPKFHLAGANLDHAEADLQMTALHLCSFSNALTGVRYLLENGACPESGTGYTPFQFAAFGNALKVVKYFLEMGFSQDNSSNLDSVLHCAARSNALEVLRVVVENNPAMDRLDGNGFAPIHYAIGRGRKLDCLEELLRAGCRINATAKMGDTALHIAAESGNAEVLDVLLKNGADPARRNQFGQTSLHLAVRARSVPSVDLLVRTGFVDPNAEDKRGKTPLHEALGKYPGVCELMDLLFRCKADANKPDDDGNSPLHVAAENEFSECLEVLIQHGADMSVKTTEGVTALSVILRKSPLSLNVFKHKLDSSITLVARSRLKEHVEMRLDFHPLLDHHLEEQAGLLRVLFDEKCKDILEHPLCKAFLRIKWRRVRMYFFARIIFYALFVVLFTSWTTVALAHNCFNESHGIDNASHCVDSTRLFGGYFHRNNGRAMESLWYALLFVALLEIVHKIVRGLTAWVGARKVYLRIDEVSEWCVILGVFLTSWFFTGKIESWQTHVGAFAVICGWTNLMIRLGQHGVLGSFVAMFTSVQSKFFEILLAYACLLIGFSVSFYVIFPHSKSFKDPWAVVVRVMAMMTTGDLGFDELFFPGDLTQSLIPESGSFSWFLHQISTKLTFLFFVFLVSIVLMNLLVGIAVSDIRGLQKTADQANLQRRLNLLCDLDNSLLRLMPDKLFQLLREKNFIEPYRVHPALTVRPRSPKEKRLPKRILESAYRIALQNLTPDGTDRTKTSKSINERSSRKRSSKRKSELRAIMSARRTTDRPTEVRIDPEDFDIREKINELMKVAYTNQFLIGELIDKLSMDDEDTDSSDD